MSIPLNLTAATIRSQDLSVTIAFSWSRVSGGLGRLSRAPFSAGAFHSLTLMSRPSAPDSEACHSLVSARPSEYS